MENDIHIIGAGLAGSEAALVAARNGCKVRLSEMRPGKTTPVHHTADAAEIVCSNSLGSVKTTTAGGCLKRELGLLASPLIDIAIQTAVPAGHALAVDRDRFAREVTRRVEAEDNIDLVREEVTSIDPRPEAPLTLVASGPLTSDPLLNAIALLLGEEHLYFFDAISPSVEHESIDLDKAYYGSRYDPDSPDYLNCPMTKEEYTAFCEALVEAERIDIMDFEPDKLFEGCVPIEIVAKRGFESMAFGPLKPVGLEDPRTGERPYAVVQLRREQVDPESWNLVGFQTRLTYPEQKRVFQMIPGLENAKFTRYGSMHRNAYIKSPYLLRTTLQADEFPRIFFAGCLAGVEGYVEDIATGHLAALGLVALAKGMEIPLPPTLTMHSSLCRAITDVKNTPFQPIAATLGLLPPLEKRIKSKKERRATMVGRSLDVMSGWVNEIKESEFAIPDAVVIPD